MTSGEVESFDLEHEEEAMTWNLGVLHKTDG